MTIKQFELLNDTEKDEIVSIEGIFLANYDEGNDMCDVYQLFDFYVACCYELDKNDDPEISAHINADELPHLVSSRR